VFLSHDTDKCTNGKKPKINAMTIAASFMISREGHRAKAQRGTRLDGLDRRSFVYDTGAMVHTYNDMSGIYLIEKERTKIMTVNGKAYCTHVAYHRDFGKGIYIPKAPVSCLSAHQLQENGFEGWTESNRLFADCYIMDRSGANKFIATQKKGIYVMNKIEKFPRSALEARQQQATKVDGDVEELVAAVVADLAQSDKKKNLVQHMHESLHHISKERLIRGIRGGNYSEWDVTEKDVKRADFTTCRGCLEGKISSYHPHRDRPEDEKLPPIGQSIHADIMYVENGTARPTPMYVSTEKTTSFGYVEEIANKSASTLMECISKNVGLFQSYGYRVKEFHSDREANFGATKPTLLKAGIRLVQTASNQHERYVERHIRSIRDGTKATLAQIRQEYELPAVFYPHLVRSVVQALNLTVNAKTGNLVPYQMVAGVPMDGRNIQHSFGSVGYFAVPHHDKYQNGEIGIVIGHEDQSGVVIAYLLRRGEVVHYTHSSFRRIRPNEQEKALIKELILRGAILLQNIPTKFLTLI